MENLGEEYKHYWETHTFFQTEEFDRWALEEALSGEYDSSSPEIGGGASCNTNNIVSERNRRKKLNERLFALRAMVPNISKMDKASIIKDAIDYIEHLNEQEQRIQSEIMEIQTAAAAATTTTAIATTSYHHDQLQELPVLLRTSKKKRPDQHRHQHQLPFDSAASTSSTSNSPIQLIELRVTYMGEKTFVVSLTCSKRTDTMLKLCEVFESLKLKIITANITSFSGTLLKTVFIEADEEEKDILQIKIQTAIAALNDPQSPMSI